MSEKKRPILMPQYMKKFHCIGAACEDSCCIGWKVSIDHETWKKYRAIRHAELSSLFEKKITRNRSSTKNEASYAKVKMEQNGRCPFLSDELLCRVQLEYGEEYLSNVCTTYPRISNTINGVLERSATMSCPEVARLALLQPEPMEFDEVEEPSSIRNLIKQNINTHELKYSNKTEKHLWMLRIFSISALQDRRYSLWERLVILGIFYDRVQNAVQNEKANEIPNLIAVHTNMLNDGSFKDAINGIPAQNTIQMELLKEIADVRYFSGVTSKRYVECFSEFLRGIQYKADSTVEEIGRRYYEAWQKYYEPYMQDHEYIFENYLVNYVFKNLFPITEKSVFDSYMMLVIHYALIKMFLIGIAGYRKVMTDDIVIKLIQSFAKTVEHNSNFVNNIMNLMKKNGFDTMAYMSILIRN